jgi:hypothetical protein
VAIGQQGDQQSVNQMGLTDNPGLQGGFQTLKSLGLAHG